MSYDATLTITVRPEVIDIARAISRALDPDVGGYDSWTPVRHTGDETATPDEYTTSTPCTSEFKEQAITMLQDPAMLHYAVTADYAARWADLTPPTLDECAAFCAGVVVEVPAVTAEPGGEPA